ncbi:hypothetical protein A2209_01820 [Candidatus Roizmanbacteria bacterium RIFOXYA1_FULL_41_12]|uniref:Uncharacterized protein n=1 Tax=Candidatus Roizmanbacteria bacterium RIFOXYA1_FULL_41_12 TaxID=1802082 RepID=A0A1F7KF25_9BACT|nr:MAG: hypothetical protein A2262_03765 [Candidatus Roizmanbacteria bacterium RIFOXYA2_FULL_41_8]OGK66469.1 MAG: hypothetical protein A2209_01820 [Candidatus Roizmanbacteria bacterium RIFOXYA1_FULL_41_12]OGK71973.1 MAG: hypothetical protein A2403_03395 [Candidatus Roizmanbacteria bacterium RIFOXYC1_FULL_41_16]OGK74873.1 MAG: hypothetical protein A2459_04750 [Candidatus Roizmanbacteria bacterium RIFOXYC2_FULL_41_10]OGK75380.1 MAG: hypothetical protein A2575_02090 [Candidatus Roizmanbacteria bac
MVKNNITQLAVEEKSKPILQFSVLCDGVAKQGNKPVFIGVFSNFVRTGVIAQFFIVNRWIYGKGTFKQKIAIKDPDLQKTIAEIPDQEFILKEEINSADIVNGFVNVNFEKPGVYWVEISLDNKLLMSYPLPVYEQQK